MDRKTIEGLLAESRDIKSELEDLLGPISTDVKELSQVISRISLLLSMEGELPHAMIENQVQTFIDTVEALRAKRFALTQLIDDARDVGRDLVRTSRELSEHSEGHGPIGLREDTAEATDATHADNTSFKSRREHRTREMSVVSAYEDAFVNDASEDKRQRIAVRERLEDAARALERMNPYDTAYGSLGWDLSSEHADVDDAKDRDFASEQSDKTEDTGWDLDSEPERKKT